jgi:acyl-CoA thioester hydrolase
MSRPQARVEVSGPRPQKGLTSSPDAIHTTRVRVRYADTDRMGVVYYANYLVWFEVARTEWLRATGWSYREMEREGVSLPVIEAHCEYRQPARYDDEVDIAARATLLTPVRIRFDYDVTRAADGTLAAVGYTVHAAVDAAGKPRRLPARVREILL